MRYEMGKQEREARSTGVVGGGGAKAVAAPGSPGPKARELQVAGHAKLHLFLERLSKLLTQRRGQQRLLNKPPTAPKWTSACLLSL
jgi:hypothetical protein